MKQRKNKILGFLLVCAVLALEARGDVMREPEPEVKQPGRLLVF